MLTTKRQLVVVITMLTCSVRQKQVAVALTALCGRHEASSETWRLSSNCAVCDLLMQRHMNGVLTSWSNEVANDTKPDLQRCAAEDRREQRSRKIATHLRNGSTVSDFVFDDTFLPLAERRVSSLYWTPVHIALRVAEFLAPRWSTRVLDIGSGVGKFCIVGAAATGARFVGVEHRQHFVRIATAAATEARVRTARFIHGDFGALDVRSFDSIYLYNPFEESCLPETYQLDATINLSTTRFCVDVRRAETLLASARSGTRVATYHGFGGEMPPNYERALRERHGSGYLEFWIKG